MGYGERLSAVILCRNPGLARVKIMKCTRRPKNGIVLLILLLGATTAFAAPKTSDLSPALDRGYQAMYNLDFGAAHNIFKAYQQAAPDDPMGYASNAAAYLFSELDRLHVLQSDLFVDDHSFEQRKKLSPDAALKVEFEAELQTGETLANRILAQRPADKNALFAVVLVNGLRGDYTALIEKRNLASLGYIKNSRIAAEKLLAIDPSCYDVYLAVGIENYLLGTNAAPVRWLLHLAGAQTDKEEGLRRLRITAEKGHYLAPFARLLLAVAALRDKDRETARMLLAGLARDFPGNQLYVAELRRIQ
jgi:hypothetical protein